MSALSKLKKNSTIKETDILADSTFFEPKDFISTSVPMLNVALSGKLNGGFTSGLTMFAGPSKHFKTSFALTMAKAYQDKYPDGIVLFYDSEFGSPRTYFTSFGLDLERIVHTPIVDIEQLKIDITNQINGLDKGDRVIIVIDSVGNLASRKEADDAQDGKTTVDMTRAKQLKSMFRIVTPHLTMKNIPMVVVNHTYKTLEMYAKDVVGGGTGSYYSSDSIFIIGRQQDKDKATNEIMGYDFVINAEKSRFIREKSKISIEVSFDRGISVWSGLLENALESGHVIKPKNAYYQRVDQKTGELVGEPLKEAAINTRDFWVPILACKKFQTFIEEKYALTSSMMISDEELSNVYAEED